MFPVTMVVTHKSKAKNCNPLELDTLGLDLAQKYPCYIVDV